MTNSETGSTGNGLRKGRPKKPSKTVKRCPACGTEDLIRLNVDVVCRICDWDSTYAYVQAGGMDNIKLAYLEHFGHPKPKKRPNFNEPTTLTRTENKPAPDLISRAKDLESA